MFCNDSRYSIGLLGPNLIIKIAGAEEIKAKFSLNDVALINNSANLKNRTTEKQIFSNTKKLSSGSLGMFSKNNPVILGANLKLFDN